MPPSDLEPATAAIPRPERRHVSERGFEGPISAVWDEATVAWLGAARVARLATADAAGVPGLVPVCFAPDAAAGVAYIALDAKPKRVAGRALKRVRNIQANPHVALLCDVYDEDWARLAYCLVHAEAALVEPEQAEHAAALALLRAKYPQYRTMPLEAQPVIALHVTRVTRWTGAARDAGAASSAALSATSTASSAATSNVTQNSEFRTQNSELRARLPFAALARGRRSVRSYLDVPVDRAVVEQVLEAGRWAPSPHGRQPWRFVVLTRPAAKQTLAEAMGDEWRRNLAMDGQNAEVVDIRLHKSYQRLLAAPVLIIPCLYEADLDRYPDPDRQAAEHLMAVQSVGAAAQTMLVAAYSLGLDGGWMCAPLFCPAAVRAALGLDARYAPQAVLTLGYAAGPPKRRARLPLADLIARYD